ncbi:hypothetical protein IDJ81_05310 [Tsuneonella flava]|uniref:DUF4115 domain-containing protein n=1 Tax=Tsuneonella flava TaxID=2055955 RepID=A0ABX7KB77_9SPHN|nr:hypothetical protein [Tsuneonella flava]QSB45533.1 hypothetical protein IDJ81_05310 [Tsuneonella flava]
MTGGAERPPGAGGVDPVEDDLDYEGLGTLLRAAGVQPSRAEAIVSGRLGVEAGNACGDRRFREDLALQCEVFLKRMARVHEDALVAQEASAMAHRLQPENMRAVLNRGGEGNSAVPWLLALSIALQLAILAFALWPFVQPYAADPAATANHNAERTSTDGRSAHSVQQGSA